MKLAEFLKKLQVRLRLEGAPQNKSFLWHADLVSPCGDVLPIYFYCTTGKQEMIQCVADTPEKAIESLCESLGGKIITIDDRQVIHCPTLEA